MIFEVEVSNTLPMKEAHQVAAMIALALIAASSRERLNPLRCSWTSSRPLALRDSLFDRSHRAILSRLRSALSFSACQVVSLFLSALIFLPASAVAAPLTCVCSDSKVRLLARDLVSLRNWET